MTERVPLRPAAIGFPEAPTHEPLVAAVLITLDPEAGVMRSYVRNQPGLPELDPELVELLRTSMEIRALPEVTA